MCNLSNQTVFFVYFYTIIAASKCLLFLMFPIKGIRKAKMHFDRISDSLKNTFSVAVYLQNEFYIINACIIYQFLL